MYGVIVLTKCVFDVSEHDRYEEPRVRNAKLLSLRHFFELLNVFFNCAIPLNKTTVNYTIKCSKLLLYQR